MAAVLCPARALDECFRKARQMQVDELEKLARQAALPLRAFLVSPCDTLYGRCEQNRRVRRRPIIAKATQKMSAEKVEKKWKQAHKVLFRFCG